VRRVHQITIFSRFGRAHGSLLPHHLTGRQAPPGRRAPPVRFVGIVKTKRYMQYCLVGYVINIFLVGVYEEAYFEVDNLCSNSIYNYLNRMYSNV